MPYVNGTMGLNWRPTQWPSFDFYLGYQIEQWWNVGRLSLQSTEILRSRGDMNLNGIVFRVGFNY